jgi:hypothetical protein
VKFTAWAEEIIAGLTGVCQWVQCLDAEGLRVWTSIGGRERNGWRRWGLVAGGKKGAGTHCCISVLSDGTEQMLMGADGAMRSDVLLIREASAR